jgi:hypothetical protein
MHGLKQQLLARAGKASWIAVYVLLVGGVRAICLALQLSVYVRILALILVR